MTSPNTVIQMQVSGVHAALLVGASCVYIAYPLRNEEDDRCQGGVSLDARAGISTSLGNQWRAVLEAHGLTTRDAWAAQSHAPRAALTCTFRLTRSELDLAIVIVDACLREFRDRWLEFTIVAPGGIARYPASFADLASLAGVLTEARARV